MKKILIALLLTTLAISIQGQTFYGHSKVSISRGLSLSETMWMDFGEITATAAGTITLSPTGVVILSGGVTAKGSVSPSVFQVTAMPSSSFIITLPSTCSLSSGVNLIYLTNFTSNLIAGSAKTDANGLFSISIGATCTIPANFSFGLFTGGFEVVANYQ